MRRRVGIILSLCSLVICLLVLTLWARCYVPLQRYSRGEAIHWGRIVTNDQEMLGSTYTLRSEHGRLSIEIDHRRFSLPLPPGVYDRNGWPRIGVPRGVQYGRSNMSPEPQWSSGFMFRRLNGPGPPAFLWQDLRIIAVPYWFLFPLTGILPARLALQLYRRRQRRRAGRCRGCGYDLRATPDRCPECGREVIAPERSSPAAVSPTP